MGDLSERGDQRRSKRIATMATATDAPTQIQPASDS
jgi:hypothetical protein